MATSRVVYLLPTVISRFPCLALRSNIQQFQMVLKFQKFDEMNVRRVLYEALKRSPKVGIIPKLISTRRLRLTTLIRKIMTYDVRSPQTQVNQLIEGYLLLLSKWLSLYLHSRFF